MEGCFDFFNPIIHFGYDQEIFFSFKKKKKFGRYITLRNASFFGGCYPTPKGFVSE
jgi:hypothetical protein